MRRLRVVILIAVAVCAVALGRSPREVRLAVRALSERAMAGDAKSLYDLARLHDYGYDSIPVDSARSTALYRMSAERGYAPAQSYLGFRYFTGEAAPLLDEPHLRAILEEHYGADSIPFGISTPSFWYE